MVSVEWLDGIISRRVQKIVDSFTAFCCSVQKNLYWVFVLFLFQFCVVRIETAKRLLKQKVNTELTLKLLIALSHLQPGLLFYKPRNMGTACLVAV